MRSLFLRTPDGPREITATSTPPAREDEWPPDHSRIARAIASAAARRSFWALVPLKFSIPDYQNNNHTFSRDRARQPLPARTPPTRRRIVFHAWTNEPAALFKAITCFFPSANRSDESFESRPIPDRKWSISFILNLAAASGRCGGCARGPGAILASSRRWWARASFRYRSFAKPGLGRQTPLPRILRGMHALSPLTDTPTDDRPQPARRPRAPHAQRSRNSPDEDLKKPLIGVANTWIEIGRANLICGRLAEHSKAGITLRRHAQ